MLTKLEVTKPPSHGYCVNVAYMDKSDPPLPPPKSLKMPSGRVLKALSLRPRYARAASPLKASPGRLDITLSAKSLKTKEIEQGRDSP